MQKLKGIQVSAFEVYHDQLSVLIKCLLGEEGDQNTETRTKYTAAETANNSSRDSKSNSKSISIQ